MIETQFASAERSSDTVIYEQYESFASYPLLNDFLSRIDQYILVLNGNRQVVFSNKAFLKDFKFSNVEDILGRRIGEIFDCRFAWCVAGCGTSGFCKDCGAVQSVLQNQKHRKDVFMECVILTKSSKAIELGVTSKHIGVNGQDFTMFTFGDISAEKQSRALEDIFFHDISNVAGGIHSMVQLLKDERLTDKEKVQAQLERCSSELLDELYAHKVLKAAKRQDLQVKLTEADSLSLIDKAVRFVERCQSARGIMTYVHHSSEDFNLITDTNLMNRVLVNMLTNATEASGLGQKVTVGANIIDREIVFWVHNCSYMTPDIQAKIFRQKFSTKKRNSGYGTHSIRIITEGYLGGRVDFESDIQDGTTFRVYLPA